MAKKKEELFEELENAKHLYDEKYNEYDESLSDSYEVKSNAVETIENVESFLSTIRNKPITIRHQINKVGSNRKKFIEAKDVKEQLERENNKAKAAAIGALGVGGVLAYTFKDFLISIAPKKAKDDFGIYILVWVIIIGLIAFVFAGYLLWKLYNRITANKQLQKSINEIYKEISELSIKISRTQNQTALLNKQINLVEMMLQEVSHLNGQSYKKFNQEDQKRIQSIINQSIYLSEEINTAI